MSVTGIICEYDPLHTGHAWLMARARAAGASAVVCAMSGNFTQRGGFAAADKLARAEMAVACGADLVLELPTVWAMSTAERFARGGVEVLTRTGVVTELLFGSESGDMAALTRCADCLDSEDLTAALPAASRRWKRCWDRRTRCCWPAPTTRWQWSISAPSGG